MKKILVVDDDADILTAIDVMLTHHDFIVRTTTKWQIISKIINN